MKSSRFLPLRRLLWQIFAGHLFVMSAALIAATIFSVTVMNELYYNQVATDLEVRARLMIHAFDTGKTTLDQDACVRAAKLLAPTAEARITIILPDGKVLYDSVESAELMDNHATRPEVIEAIQNGVGQSTRFSRTRQRTMLYKAVPIVRNGSVLAIVRTAMPVEIIRNLLWSKRSGIVAATLIIGGFAVIISWILSRRIARPLAEMRQGAERFARGDFSHHLHVPKTEEPASLARAMNEMAEQLSHRIRALNEEHAQQEAILTSMVEGVIAVDTEQRIIMLNDSAATLMGSSRKSMEGKSLEAAVRNISLQEFMRKALSSAEPIEDEFEFHAQGDQMIQAHGSVLRTMNDERLGAVAVLNNVTRLRRLENMRRDFVANVSHELRTPITSIKGFVEMLLDGVLETPDKARHFLGIVQRQSDRLNAIIEDLLILSRMEAEKEKKQLRFEPTHIAEVIQSAVDLCQPKAESRHCTINITCPDELEAVINAPLLEQAVANLVDNATKYGKEGDSVQVEAMQEGGDLLIRVIDHGPGIPPEHLPRLFERFYTVDKARSRTLGGTGLGLAITKHIALVHGGRVDVQSKLGTGTTFSIYLPLIQGA